MREKRKRLMSATSNRPPVVRTMMNKEVRAAVRAAAKATTAAVKAEKAAARAERALARVVRITTKAEVAAARAETATGGFGHRPRKLPFIA